MPLAQTEEAFARELDGDVLTGAKWQKVSNCTLRWRDIKAAEQTESGVKVKAEPTICGDSANIFGTSALSTRRLDAQRRHVI